MAYLTAKAKDGGAKRFSFNKKTRRAFFYGVLILIPLLQLAIFYFGVNFNSILTAFQRYEVSKGEYVWTGFSNFSAIFENFASVGYFGDMFVRSILGYIIPLAITFIPSLLISFYVHKKMFASRFFRVVLYLPSLFSVLAVALIQKFLVEEGLPELVFRLTGNKPEGYLSNLDTAFWTLIILQTWFNFCSGIMLYPAAMSSIPQSSVESAQIDGCSMWKEFWYITLPQIYPTVVVIFITGMAGIFRTDLNVFNMYGEGADYSLYTVGYYIYNGTLNATYADYPFLASLGVFLTLILAPVVMVVRALLNKLGPNDER